MTFGRRAPANGQPLWLCSTEFPSLGLSWASPTDMSGTYGLTKVKCTPVYFGGGNAGRPFSLVRSLVKVWEVIVGV